MKRYLIYITIFTSILLFPFYTPASWARGSIHSGLCKVYERQPDPVLELVVYLEGQRREGVSLKFFPTGEVRELAWYHNDQRHGATLRFDQQGALESSAHFLDGALSGILEEYGGKGQLLSRRRFVAGKLHGASEYYDSQGSLEKRVIYQEGRPTRTEEF